MIEPFRREFNARWTAEKYAELKRVLEARTRTPIEFRVCETPCFFPRTLMDRMVRAGVELTAKLVANPEYMRASNAAIPERFCMRGEDVHPHFMTVDFGLVRGVDGELEPKLVEMQAFPSVFGFQAVAAEAYREVYGLDALAPGAQMFLGGLDEAGYWERMREVIVGDHDPENVVLTEVEPETQKTKPDFRVHEQKLGIRTVDLARVVKQGRKLFYERDGRLVPIARIYNRAIVDEIERKGIALPFAYADALDVVFAGHPNWYFRVSKFSIPHLEHDTVPAAVFLDDFLAGVGRERLPEERERWVSKPLYSFAGKGVQFAPTDAELNAIPPEERHNFLIQERVQFEPVIRTPEGWTQAEIRILYVWPEGKVMQPMISLVRMGRGTMMGVDHNRDKTWVGASAGFVV
jgi:hypothetical protein